MHEALKQVEAQELDLVEVAPDAQPPVCRMMDYGKFRYEQKKKSHGPKKHSVVEIKEVKMGSRTDAHDVEHKVRNIRQFIGKAKGSRYPFSFAAEKSPILNWAGRCSGASSVRYSMLLKLTSNHGWREETWRCYCRQSDGPTDTARSKIRGVKSAQN